MNSVGTCPTEEWKPAQLSGHVCAHTLAPQTRSIPASTWDGTRCESAVPRKEVIQPHLPVRLPCYDFTPITDPTLDACLPHGVSPAASGVADFRGVTGGVYKTRERIHRDVLTHGY